MIAVDGHDVEPIRASLFPLAIGQRLDLLIDIPPGTSIQVLATLEGLRRRSGIVLASPGADVARIAAEETRPAPALDNSLEVKLIAAHPLAARRPDFVHRIVLAGGMKPYAWSLNGEYWPKITPLMLAKGQRVELKLIKQTMMPHPMHLHGHAFEVLGINGKQLRGAVRDTIYSSRQWAELNSLLTQIIPGVGHFTATVSIIWWPGMMTEFRYQGIAIWWFVPSFVFAEHGHTSWSLIQKLAAFRRLFQLLREAFLESVKFSPGSKGLSRAIPFLRRQGP